ncbi:branched-chain amino acid ABC transporter permease [Pseudonocardia bannensis]|uniref:Branched-chain amino acid ABC transporter permease n=1 Tax=Pseudonocardia bannensis TaxID=630973 RepID=A0A848DIG9_9PSEU|nr:branched-chain amino acid ABC transporter permease [Pseudonocardia bannensis]NMH92492.1 branched-chain amino acid ABC transporter permease [Pseudonocardia bannensis]
MGLLESFSTQLTQCFGSTSPPVFVFLQQIINGLVLGSLIGLIALGYTMVYGIIQLINFAHGEVFMVGAYGGLATFTYLLPTFAAREWYIALPLVLLGGALISVLVAVAMERFAYRPLRNAPRLAPLITALGVSVALQEAVRVFYPNATAALPFPNIFVPGSLSFSVGGGDIAIKYSGILLLVVSLVLAIALQIFVDGSRMGRAMRATAQDRDVARLMGINPDRVIVLTFVIGGALAGIGGVLYGGYLNNINIDMGFQTGIFAFTAAVLGGIGSIRGAVIGGLLIGLVKSLGGQCLPGGTAYDYVWIFVVLIVVLVFRPQGFFGETERVRA